MVWEDSSCTMSAWSSRYLRIIGFTGESGHATTVALAKILTTVFKKPSSMVPPKRHNPDRKLLLKIVSHPTHMLTPRNELKKPLIYATPIFVICQTDFIHAFLTLEAQVKGIFRPFPRQVSKPEVQKVKFAIFKKRFFTCRCQLGTEPVLCWPSRNVG